MNNEKECVFQIGQHAIWYIPRIAKIPAKMRFPVPLGRYLRVPYFCRSQSAGVHWLMNVMFAAMPGKCRPETFCTGIVGGLVFKVFYEDMVLSMRKASCKKEM